MAKGMFQTLPGFRDFRPEDCAVRNYLFRNFREVARRYGFLEYETPVVEGTELYLKKSGGELGTQLFRFDDQGGRDVTLRPEVTASLGRLLIACQRDYPKPLRWFEIGQCFRYESPQAGRTREFYQFNVDLIGETEATADAELIALSIDLMRILGFRQGDFVVRLSDRGYWQGFAQSKGLSDQKASELLTIVDKLERESESISAAKLEKLGLSLEEIQSALHSRDGLSPDLQKVLVDLEARGMRSDVEVDLSIVRGLAYYTGVVFEVFDARKEKRAIAGGGRYDTLVSALSDGKLDLPAVGFAMGDVVIRNLIEDTPHAFERMQQSLESESACDVFLVVADEDRRQEALGLASMLRANGFAVSYSLTKTAFNKQFKAAERARASLALVIGNEYPEVSLKVLASREELKTPAGETLIPILSQYLKK